MLIMFTDKYVFFRIARLVPNHNRKCRDSLILARGRFVQWWWRITPGMGQNAFCKGVQELLLQVK